jgi:hypothetical protein
MNRFTTSLLTPIIESLRKIALDPQTENPGILWCTILSRVLPIRVNMQTYLLTIERGLVERTNIKQRCLLQILQSFHGSSLVYLNNSLRIGPTCYALRSQLHHKHWHWIWNSISIISPTASYCRFEQCPQAHLPTVLQRSDYRQEQIQFRHNFPTSRTDGERNEAKKATVTRHWWILELMLSVVSCRD